MEPTGVSTASTSSKLPPTPPSEAAATSTTTTKMDTSLPAITARSTVQTSNETKHIWIITGPAGCGKTSVAEHLHATFGLPYFEGDTFHTPENVAKMRAGQALTDADRWDWLILLREEALSALSPDQSAPATGVPSNQQPPGVILTCSALKRKYRDVLRIASYHHPHVRVHFIFLQASEALLMDRVRARMGHYMKDYMVRSQFQSLETPQADEVASVEDGGEVVGRRGDVLRLDASGTSEEVRRLAEGLVGSVMGRERLGEGR